MDLTSANAEYKRLTGEDAYLYGTNPGDGRGTRYVFATAARPLTSNKARQHMQTILDLARSGESHSAIMAKGF